MTNRTQTALLSIMLAGSFPALAQAEDDVFGAAAGAAISGNVLANDSDAGVPTVSFGPRRGEVTLGEDGNFTYTPSEGFEGSDSFVYTQVVDGREVPSLVRLFSGRFQIVSAADTTQVLSTGSARNRTPLSLASREDGGAGTLWTLSGDAAAAQLRSSLSGSRDAVVETWQPNGQGREATIYSRNGLPWQDFRIGVGDVNADVIESVYTGFNVQAEDGAIVADDAADGLADEWLFAGANQILAPIAADDTFSGDVDETISGRVLLNDEPNGIDFASFLVSGPANGEFVGINASIYGGLAPFGNFSYQPNPGFEGTDSFSYVLLGSSPGAMSRIATVTLEVGDAPEVVETAATKSDLFVTTVDRNVTGSVAANDENVDTVILVGEPRYGEFPVPFLPTGVFTYQPNPGFEGLDSFAYQVETDGVLSPVETAFVVVGDVQVTNRTGNARNRLVLTAEADRNRANVRLGAESFDSIQNFTLTPRAGTDGVYTFGLDNTVLETWQPNAAGTDATVFKPNGNVWQDFRIGINENDGSLSIISAYTGRALAAQEQVDGGDVGTAQADADDPAQDWVLSGPRQTAPAIGRDDSFTVASGDILNGRVLSNDDSNDFDLLSLLVTRPENGEFVGQSQIVYDGLSPFGTFQYQSAPGFVGTDSFVYQVFGGGNGAPSRYVTVSIDVSE